MLVKQSLDHAVESERKNILFGFNDDEYYKVAVEELEKIKSDYANLNIKILGAAEATAEYFTGGVKDTELVLGNINGDFATDIELFGKGTSYSVGMIFDGRMVVELGTGGTAPDLLDLWKAKGTLLFNPMAFIEGISLAGKFASGLMKKDGKDANLLRETSSAIEKAMYITTDKGIVPPIVKGKFTKNEGTEYTEVSTHTFVKSVQLEALKLLEGRHPNATKENINKAENELENMVRKDKAIFTTAKSYPERWEKANITYNNARIAAGEIDPFNPDYNIVLPEDTYHNLLRNSTLLSLQEARAGLIEAVKNGKGESEAKTSLRKALKNLGVEHVEQQLNKELVVANAARTNGGLKI